MAKFSKISKKRLSECDTRLQTLFNKVVEKFDITIVCGYRGKEEQDMAYHNGYSRVKYPGSKHNQIPSLAVDVAPYDKKIKNIDWDNNDRFIAMGYYVLGYAAALGIAIRWGGDWDMDLETSNETFIDLPHFELL